MKQKLLSLLVLTLCWASSTWAEFSGNGAGTSDDPYQIASAAQLMEFAGIVNDGTTGACAVLTGNIDLSEVLSETVKWTPIGNSSSAYTGIFDGGGFTISNFSLTTTAADAGLFGSIANNAVIKNFTIEGDISSTHQFVGLVGSTRGGTTNISNIHSKLNITCNQSRQAGFLGSNQGGGTVNIDRCTYSGTITPTGGNIGGFVGLALNSSSAYINITNCLFNGTINNGTSSGDIGGFVGYCNSGAVTIRNCLSNGTIYSAKPGQFFGTLNNSNCKCDGKNYYVAGNVIGSLGSGKTLKGTAPVTATSVQLTSGEICYLLNGSINGGTNWYQTIGTDNYPIPFSTSQRVYKKSASAYASFDVADEKIQISGAADLTDFAGVVNTGGYSLNAVLTADIDMDGADISNFPIGTQTNPYTGTFDGQKHKISNLQLINASAPTSYGMFNTGANVTLKDFWLDGSCAIQGTEEVGLIGRHSGGEGHFEGLGNCGDVTGSNRRDGGLIGAAWGNNKTIAIKNCWTTGRITGGAVNAGGAAAIIAWFNSATMVMENCWTIAEVSGATSNAKYVYDNGATNTSASSFTNCYSKEGSQTTMTAITTTDPNNQLTSGELCYLLNGSTSGGTNWYQTLETDDFPYPYSTGHSMVYAEHQHCDGSAYDATRFANTQNKDAHNKVSGFCTYCGEPDDSYAGYIEPNAEGYYEIDSEAKLNWFSTFVSAGTTSANVGANAILTGDIELTAPLTNPIGNASKPYTGTFDGQGRSITNLSTEPCKYNGLFGYIQNATIKDFTISGAIETLTSGELNYIGVIGLSEGTSEISNILSSLNITVKCGSDAGGILGSGGSASGTDKLTISNCSYSGKLTVNEGVASDQFGGIVGYTAAATIKNCLFSGMITGSISNKGFGGIVGYTREYIQGIQNCLSVGNISGTGGRYGAIIGNFNSTTDKTSVVKNNYYQSGSVAGAGNHADKIDAIGKTAEEIACGEVCYLLNGNQSNIAWYQTIGTDTYPTLDSSSEQVRYVGDAGYTTFYDATNGWELLGDAKAYIGTINGSALHLDEIEDIPANEAVVIGGTYYNRVSKATTTGDATGNVLLGSDGTVKGGTNIYALSTLGGTEPVGFYPVGNDVTIPEGKAYLVYSGSSPVKGFTFVFDDDATSINEELRMKNEEFNEGAIYNIAGQRMNKMQKGINIINGKKVMVK